MSVKINLLVLFAFIVWPAAFTQKQDPGLTEVFGKYGIDNGCFVLYDQANDEYLRYNSARCDSGFIPASTFKIPHSLIALEEGLIEDSTQVIKWDGHQWPVKNWNRDQTLRTAVKYSCVWVFTGFAEKMPVETYYRYIRAFDYGNKDLTGQPSRFWLAGLFRISANQQVAFLRKFYNDELPVSKRSTHMVKDFIILEKQGSSTWSGKTGGGMLDDNRYVMWLVGYVEKDGKPYFYAMNFTTGNFNKYSRMRYDIVKEVLQKKGLID